MAMCSLKEGIIIGFSRIDLQLHSHDSDKINRLPSTFLDGDDNRKLFVVLSLINNFCHPAGKLMNGIKYLSFICNNISEWNLNQFNERHSHNNVHNFNFQD